MRPNGSVPLRDPAAPLFLCGLFVGSPPERPPRQASVSNSLDPDQVNPFTSSAQLVTVPNQPHLKLHGQGHAAHLPGSRSASRARRHLLICSLSVCLPAIVRIVGLQSRDGLCIQVSLRILLGLALRIYVQVLVWLGARLGLRRSSFRIVIDAGLWNLVGAGFGI